MTILLFEWVVLEIILLKISHLLVHKKAACCFLFNMCEGVTWLSIHEYLLNKLRMFAVCMYIHLCIWIEWMLPP